MIIWTPAVLSVLYACVLYFCILHLLSAMSMFHMERHSRNTLIIIIIILIIIVIIVVVVVVIVVVVMLSLSGFYVRLEMAFMQWLRTSNSAWRVQTRKIRLLK